MMKRFGLEVAAATVVMLVAGAVPASASSIYLCLSETPGAAMSGGVEGRCPAPTRRVKYAKVALPKDEVEQQALLAILQHVKYEEKGIGGKPTIQFSGVNVQVVNGEGATSTVNGAGNLVLGYDENFFEHEQSGSHDLVLGEEQTFNSFGGIASGFRNTLSGSFAVADGLDNTASGAYSYVSGQGNTASGMAADVTGGSANSASAPNASVSGGESNTASGNFSSILGGHLLKQEAEWGHTP